MRKTFFFGSLLLTLLNCPAQSFTFDVQAPSTNAIIGDNLAVQVSIVSTLELQSVTATVAGRTANLAYSLAAAAWTNTISLAGLSNGPQTLTIVATDVSTNSNQVNQVFVHDVAPVVTVAEPRDGTVARPDFPIDVTAFASGSVVIQAFSGNTLLATGTNALTANLAIPGADGSIATVTFVATDSYGLTVSTNRSLYVFTSTNWMELNRFGGPIFDVTTNTILYRDGNVLKTRSRSSGVDTVLVDEPDIAPAAGALTAHGAVFGAGQPFNSPSIYEWRDGTLTNLGEGMFLSGNANYAIWQESYGTGLVFYDLAAQATNLLATNFDSASLCANGDVVYVTEPQHYVTWNVMRYRNGSSTLLAQDTTSYSLYGAMSDGTNVIYGKDPYPATNVRFIAMNDGVTESLLSTNGDGLNAFPPSFAINSGWMAFTELGNSGVTQVWTRSPAGNLSKRTALGTSSGVVALSSEGGLIYLNGGRMYLDRGTNAPIDLGVLNTDFGGELFWEAGTWYMQLGRSLFTVNYPLGLALGWDSNQRLQFTITADSGSQVIIQSSPDLIHWSDLTTNTLNNTNCLQLVAPPAAESPAQFYRILRSN